VTIGERVAAVGGTRTVPAPDPIATDYLLLGLRLDQHTPGLVDGYFGPAALKAQVDLEQGRSPARLREDAQAQRARVATDVANPERRAWLDAQLAALEAQAAVLAGDEIGFEARVASAIGFSPARRDDAEFLAATAAIDARLPGDAPLTDRLEAWGRRLVIPVDRLPAVVDWLVERVRARAAQDFGLPPDEDLRVALVTGQPWTGYNWYDGGGRSRVDLNTDLPTRAPDLIRTIAHETYPGHHLEQAWKEADLVEGGGLLEASLLLLNTPECVVSEGLANVGTAFASPLAERADLLVELFERAGLALAADSGDARATAEIAVAIDEPRHALGAIRGEAARRRFTDGRSHAEVLDYLIALAALSPDVAAKRLEFIEHPMWRTYVFVYAEGESLVRRWIDAGQATERTSRFGRLLHEQFTPDRLLVSA
jgi:hypothetical protein